MADLKPLTPIVINSCHEDSRSVASVSRGQSKHFSTNLIYAGGTKTQPGFPSQDLRHRISSKIAPYPLPGINSL